ncbi:hypothetical protein Tco_0099230 [Tanacetum coccineum]
MIHFLLFVRNRDGAPHGDELGLIKPLWKAWQSPRGNTSGEIFDERYILKLLLIRLVSSLLDGRLPTVTWPASSGNFCHSAMLAPGINVGCRQPHRCLSVTRHAYEIIISHCPCMWSSTMLAQASHHEYKVAKFHLILLRCSFLCENRFHPLKSTNHLVKLTLLLYPEEYGLTFHEVLIGALPNGTCERSFLLCTSFPCWALVNESGCSRVCDGGGLLVDWLWESR